MQDGNTDTSTCMTQGSVEAQDSVDEAGEKHFVESGRKVGQGRGFGGEGRQEVPDRSILRSDNFWTKSGSTTDMQSMMVQFAE